jgi:hypothetical protein
MTIEATRPITSRTTVQSISAKLDATIVFRPGGDQWLSSALTDNLFRYSGSAGKSLV